MYQSSQSKTAVRASSNRAATLACALGVMGIAAGCSGAVPDATEESTDNLGMKGANGHGGNHGGVIVKPLDGRVVADGIPGAAAISAVGTFLAGGPIHDKPELAAFTQKGRVLDPSRIVVGALTNYGAPKANAHQAEGSFVSIDPSGASTLHIPPRFAQAGGQVSALNGAVQMYSSQSIEFRNGVYTPTAVTASETGVSNPLGISINNAFGRLWPANAPYGLEGPGTSSIDDPDGRPLKGAPNQVTGGVYLGDTTGRLPTQIIPGALHRGAVGTAFLGASPDGSTRAVFAVIAADGSIVQEHTGKALDGLAPAGTIEPLIATKGRCDHDHDHDHGHGDDDDDVSPRLGAVVSYKPTISLFVSQPHEGSIKVIELGVTGAVGNEVYAPKASHVIHSSSLDFPVDLTPVVIETTDKLWAANSTMEEGTDFYVANRGNNTIVRMHQDGTVVAIRKVRANGHDLGEARVNGIASSPDQSKIWVTYTGRLAGEKCNHHDRKGGVLELPAF